MTSLADFATKAARVVRLDRPVHGPVDRAFQRVAPFWWLAVLAVGALLYLFFLGERPLRFEEGRRALQAIALLDGASWWRLEVLGVPYVNKPPLLPWLMAGAGWLIGAVNEWAVRLPAVSLVILGAVAAGAMARRAVEENRDIAALCGGIAFLTSILIIGSARLGETDTLVTVFDGLAFTAWVAARMDGRRAPLWWVLVCFFLAATFFTKGPIPAVFVIAPMLVVPALERNGRGLLLALAVILVALIPLAMWARINIQNTSMGAWSAELRIPSTAHGIKGILRLINFRALPTTVVLVAPWLILVGLWLRRIRDRWVTGDAWIVRALVIYAFPIAFLVLIAPSSSPRYIMPALWPLAVLSGAAAAELWRHGRFAAMVIVGSLVAAICYQAVVIFAVEGKTRDQRALRLAGIELAAALARLPETPAVLREPEYNHNLLAYARRRFDAVSLNQLACAGGIRWLLASDRAAPMLRQLAGWRELPAPVPGQLVLFERTAPATASCSEKI